MSPIARKEYTEALSPHYRSCHRKRKSGFLDGYCQIVGYHRKYAIHKLNHCLDKKIKRKPGRPSFYNQDYILKPLRKIWKASDMPCSIRLKIIIKDWLPFMEEELHPMVKKALLKISAATIDRVLKPYRLGARRHMYGRTKPGKLLKTHIPIKNNQWDESRPGFLEADTVAHCGTTLLGEFVNTIDTVDIATGWSEQRAIFGKSAHDVVDQIQDIEKTLPFKLLGFDSDNGCEFINHTLIKYLTHRPKDIVEFTRSRPYHKDDNAHIEQKNWTHVRSWFGYTRFDNPDVVSLFNDLYKNEWRIYHNFFLPSTKLIAKERIGSRIIKRHDEPKTPLQRLWESRFIDDETKQKLMHQFKDMNPFKLKAVIEQKLKAIFAIAKLNLN